MDGRRLAGRSERFVYALAASRWLRASGYVLSPVLLIASGVGFAAHDFVGGTTSLIGAVVLLFSARMNRLVTSRRPVGPTSPVGCSRQVAWQSYPLMWVCAVAGIPCWVIGVVADRVAFIGVGVVLIAGEFGAIALHDHLHRRRGEPAHAMWGAHNRNRPTRLGGPDMPLTDRTESSQT